MLPGRQRTRPTSRTIVALAELEAAPDDARRSTGLLGSPWAKLRPLVFLIC